MKEAIIDRLNGLEFLYNELTDLTRCIGDINRFQAVDKLIIDTIAKLKEIVDVDTTTIE